MPSRNCRRQKCEEGSSLLTEGSETFIIPRGKFSCHGCHAEFVHPWVLGYFRICVAAHRQVLVLFVSHSQALRPVWHCDRLLPDVSIAWYSNRSTTWRCSASITRLLDFWQRCGLNSSYRPARRGFTPAATLNSLTNVRCTEASSVWRIIGPYNGPRPTLECLDKQQRWIPKIRKFTY